MLRNATRVALTGWIWPATTHPRADLFRLRKAILYADIIEAGSIPVEAVDGFTTGQWNALSLIARGKPPSAETRTMILKLLSERAAWRERLQRASPEAGRSDSR
jgi:hypothetical protein